MIQVNRIYLIFNRLVTKKFLVDTSDTVLQAITEILLNIWLKTPHLELYKNNL